ncbi:hypothetical protein [Couchioplanes azureus]|uniref:hypothetical protein n=1 Tax=Couchioplanes caeruleus TaxID=56438 RepID=UPI001986240E|nr:hypothetical protein [Couchioplanes caeruleus]GGQ51707.1 hypothetical protein GCM10010166_20760 [Couchioplanes caeruleus subsp. azureus]
MNRRTLLVTLGWAGAAVLAVLAGIAGIGVLGAGLTSAGTSPRTEAQVARELAELAPSAVSGPPAGQSPTRPGSPSARPQPSSARPSSARPGTPRPSRPATGTSRTLPTRGGTVVARCVSGAPEIVSMSPAPGFALHEQEGDEGEFRSTSDNHDRVRFTVVCSLGRPAVETR